MRAGAGLTVQTCGGQIWKSEGGEYIADKVPADTKTIFIDGQIILMQSRVDGCRSWRDFALKAFGRRLESAHALFDHVILAFDNYKATPIFKSIEQAKRTKASSGFVFTAGQKLQDTPPPPEVWPSALQNRAFKSHVICVVVGILLDHYAPPRRGTSLTVDFVNSVHVAYPVDADDQHEVLGDNTELGESDVKFMRYADQCDRLVVDSIDSDVVLIALLYVESGGRADVFVRRMATRAIDAPAEASRTGKRHKTPARKYELVHVRSLRGVLQGAVRQAVGPSLVMQDAQVTAMLVVTMLLTGSDYCRKLPRIGPRKLLESLHVVIPGLLACSSYSSANGFVLDEARAVDGFYVQVYHAEFGKHLSSGRLTYAALYSELRASSLSDTVKNAIPTPERLCTTVRNLNWILAYWHLRNSNVHAPHDE